MSPPGFPKGEYRRVPPEGVPFSGVDTFTLRSAEGLAITITNAGAAWMGCRVPMAGGAPREVLLGHPLPADHLSQPGYLGAIVGRYANRIAGSSFALDGQQHQLVPNEGEHHLHGGPGGLHRQVWRVDARTGDTLTLSHASPSGDQGYPGSLHVQATYRVTARQVTLDLEASTTAPTLVNLSSHAYFNLDGEGHGSILGHRLQIHGGRYLPVRPDLIPTGEHRAVAGTPFDFLQPRRIGEALDRLQATGERPRCHDHCWIIDPVADRPMASLWSTDGALRLDLHSDAPGLQFYAGELLAHSIDRHGRPHTPHAGLALEPQALPDSPHHPHWPQAVLRPDQVYRHRIAYCFNPA